jgi:hypothetical protein
LFLDFSPEFSTMVALSPNGILMNGKSHSGKQQGSGQTGSGSTKGALLLAVLGIGGLLVAIAVFNFGSPPKTGPDSGNSPNAHPTLVTTPPDEPASHPGIPAREPGDIAKPATKTPTQVVDTIASIATITNEITHEQAEQFKLGLTELVRQGAASVPAIQDYLDKNVDSNYGDVKGADELGYSSLRHALVDTLKQIGGPEAENSMLHVLQTTAEPNEVAELGKDLEQMAPGQHRDEVMQAAKEALDMAYSGQLGANVERGPLFRLFQMYGMSYAPPEGTVPPPSDEREIHDGVGDKQAKASPEVQIK